MTPRLTPEEAVRKGIVDVKLRAQNWEIAPHRPGSLGASYSLLGCRAVPNLPAAILAKIFCSKLMRTEADPATYEGREHEAPLELLERIPAA